MDDFAEIVLAEMPLQLAPNSLNELCRPAYADSEVDAEVTEGPKSLIYDEAENRLHAQKAIMYHLMK